MTTYTMYLKITALVCDTIFLLGKRYESLWYYTWRKKEITTLNIPTDTQPRIFDNFLITGIGLIKINQWHTNASSNQD